MMALEQKTLLQPPYVGQPVVRLLVAPTIAVGTKGKVIRLTENGFWVKYNNYRDLGGMWDTMSNWGVTVGPR